ncbi:MAG: rhodanese-like domain-containing protein [Gemmataceae bacterium]
MTPRSVPEITVHQLAEMLRQQPRPFLLDVRQPVEHQHARLEGSHLVPLNTLMSQLADLRERIAEGRPIVVYCHHGMRSLIGAQALIQAGFSNVSSLAGGIEAWSVEIDPSVPRY